MELTAEHLVNFLETPGVHVLVHTCVCVCACAGLHPTRSSNLRTSRSRARAWEAKVAARFLKEGRQEGRIDQQKLLEPYYVPRTALGTEDSAGDRKHLPSCHFIRGEEQLTN